MSRMHLAFLDGEPTAVIAAGYTELDARRNGHIARVRAWARSDDLTDAALLRWLEEPLHTMAVESEVTDSGMLERLLTQDLLGAELVPQIRSVLQHPPLPRTRQGCVEEIRHLAATLFGTSRVLEGRECWMQCAELGFRLMAVVEALGLPKDEGGAILVGS